jgi:hypothetical protein
MTWAGGGRSQSGAAGLQPQTQGLHFRRLQNNSSLDYHAPRLARQRTGGASAALVAVTGSGVARESACTFLGGAVDSAVQRAGLFQVHAALPAACMRPDGMQGRSSASVVKAESECDNGN